uniref:Testis cDNA, clone: QtsA-20855, similar to human thymic stromal lymphopoietin (TSLP), transcript variant2 n=1 Tax=Macaca fascicularis TaxID=9541 RepID=Q4R5U0_MACFA|nr:unnamed protein product [Macaca fascicularis]
MTAMHPEAAYLQIFSPIGRANRKRVLLLHFSIFLLSNAYAITAENYCQLSQSSMLRKLPSTFEE